MDDSGVIIDLPRTARRQLTLHDLHDEMEGAGLHPEYLISDGNIHRCKTNEDRRTDRAGWYIISQHGDFISAVYGDWRGGWSEHWVSIEESTLTPTQRATIQTQQAEAKRQHEESQRQRHEQAALEALSIIEQADEADPNHYYLIKKHVQPYGIYQVGTDLIIPVKSRDGSIAGYQRIPSDGRDKRFSPGTPVKGHFFPIGKLNQTIYIVEGYATGASIHEATGELVVVAFNCGNLPDVAKIMREQHPNLPIAICADNDLSTEGNPGLTKARQAAKAVKGSIHYPRIGGDFNDVAVTQGLEAVRKQLGLQAKQLVISLEELLEREYQTDYVIDKRIVERGVNQIFGESGHLKSFVSLDMMMCVAAGIPWHRHDVKQGPVLYVVGEDLGGYKQRAMAWLQEHKLEPKDVPIQFYIMPVLIPDPVAVAQFRQELDAFIEAHETLQMICLDTKARCFLGNENSTEDANAWVACIDEIVRDYETTFLIVHHTGHMEKDRSRGAYAFLGALDSEYKVTKTASGEINIRTIKAPKNDEAPPDCWLQPITIQTPYKFKDGRVVTSLILRDMAQPAESSVKIDLPTGHEKTLIEIIHHLAASQQRRLTSQGLDLPPAVIVLADEVKQKFYVSSGANSKRERDRFYKAFNRLHDSLLARFDGARPDFRVEIRETQQE